MALCLSPSLPNVERCVVLLLLLYDVSVSHTCNKYMIPVPLFYEVHILVQEVYRMIGVHTLVKYQ